MTTAASGITIFTIRQNGMLFRCGINRTNDRDVGAGVDSCTVLSIGPGFGAALALPMPAIPIPDMRPSERIIAINFSGIDKLVSFFQIK